jgi:transcriptional regulator of heat shock response
VFECDEIKKTIRNKSNNIDELCNEASSLLSGLSDCAGVVVAPTMDGHLKHIEFVPVGNDKALVILVTENEDRDTEKYFKKMGYNTVIPWKEMSLVH